MKGLVCFNSLSRRLSRMLSEQKIDISAKEAIIFKTLLEAAGRAGKPVVLRVAGGWIRDKVILTKIASRKRIERH